MFKKAMVLIVIVTMLASLMTSGFASGIEAYPKNGFRLVAQDSDSTGIAIDTEFLLETEDDYSLEEIRNAFSIDGEPSPTIEELDTNFYSINLARPLMENSLYTFRISMDKETTWVFQTQSAFEITGSLPGEKSLNVPVNSGIEINFSHENFTNLQEHFEITPAVKGSFEVHKKTAVFVPDKLDYDTVYTVRVKKGIKIQGTNREIDEDYIFSFETASSVNTTPLPDEIVTSISVGRYLYDFASDENPEVLVNYSIYNRSGRKFTPPEINAQIGVYSYSDFDSFFDAIKEKNSTPYWANSYKGKFTPVDKLQKVLDFEQVLNEDNEGRYGYTYLKVPQTLPEGYYILDGNWKDVRFQTFLQITNTGIYISESNTKTLVWLNDLSTQNPIENASISFDGYDEVYTSKDDGVAYFDSINTPETTNNNRYYSNYYSYNRYNRYMIVTTKDGKSSVLDCSSFSYLNENKYWSYFYTDRGMYKSDDTINIWGYIKNRYENEQIDNLTLELNNNYYYSNSAPIIKQNLDVNNSFFEGSIKLPDLPQGSYYITLKKGDTLIINQYIRVENYTKPSYKLEITKDKEAIFVDEEANFNVKAAFFEGTGVSNVNITYNVSASSLGQNIYGQTEEADLKGNVGIKYSPTATSNVQGIRSARIDARATLPESGEIRASDYLRVFVNDINIDANAKIKDGKATVSAKVNKIVLDRLNNGTAKNSSDYLGDPVSNQKINGTVIKNAWVKTENGTYYDYINKITHKRYSYSLEKEVIDTFSMETSSDGTTSYNFDAPEIRDSYYTVEIESTDGNGRNMSYTLYCGKVYNYSRYNSNPTYTLEGSKDSYRLGESVDLSFNYGAEPLPEGKYLYYKSQNGTYDYDIETSSTYSFNFSEKEIPNATITGVYFNGKTYVYLSYNALYDVQEKNLTIEATTDKDFYKPGDSVTINLDVTDENGNPVKSTINISIVDEAFFYLLDQNVDLLSSLYARVTSGVYFQGKSHVLTRGDNYLDDGRIDIAPTAEANGGGKSDSSEPNIRENFKDTAQFITVQTNKNGRGQTTFKLPDNITSWRVTLSAISEDLYAGSDKVSMIVTLPFFINYSFNSTYLEGDEPILGVNAYGNGLDENDDVTFEVTGSDESSPKLTATGKAFERINIPLWTLNEGYQDITVKAYSDKGYSDAVKHSFNVVKSYYQIEKALFYDAESNMTIEGGKSGYTDIVFQDKSSGMYLSDLFCLRYGYGNRIDQIISNYTASNLLAEYFEDIYYGSNVQKPSLNEYQKSDGGLSLLPYSESDLELTSKLTYLAKSMVNTELLKDYYYENLESKSASDRVKALYGLSVLEEPILLDLEKVAQIDNLSTKDLLYIALAYCELGDISAAEQIYQDKIYSFIENYEPYYRVNEDGDQDDILELTSLCAYLTAKIQAPESQGLYGYCKKNYTRDILIAAERLMFISNALKNQEPKQGKITYSLAGEETTVTLENGSSHHISLLPFQLADFNVTSVEGDVSAVSIFKEDMLEINTVDDNISVRRTYLFTNDIPLTSNTLKQGDVIKVRLNWDISDEAFDGVYEITDYLPSGLKPYNSYWNTEGQKISFYVYNSSYWRSRRYIEYYARVVSAGTYTAQGPVIQGRTSRDNINTGKTEIVTIEATDPIITPIEELPIPTPTPVEDILHGDVDGNNSVNSIDFGYMRMYLLGLKSEFPMPDKYGDLNGDESVNALDLGLMRKYLLGYIKEFPIENMK